MSTTTQDVKLDGEDITYLQSREEFDFKQIITFRRAYTKSFYVLVYERVKVASFQLNMSEWEDHESVYIVRQYTYDKENGLSNYVSTVKMTEELGRLVAKQLNDNERPRRNALLAETNTHPTFNGLRGYLCFIKTSHFRP